MAEKRGLPRIAVNLRRLREVRGLTQIELAVAARLGRSTITGLESGERVNPEQATILALAEALSVEPGEITADEVVSVGITSLEEAITAFQADASLVKMTAPQPEEYQWLRAQPPAFWRGVPPTPETIHYLILGYRHRKRTGLVAVKDE